MSGFLSSSPSVGSKKRKSSATEESEDFSSPRDVEDSTRAVAAFPDEAGESSESTDSSGSGSDDDGDKQNSTSNLSDAEKAKLKNRGKGSSCHQCKSRRNFTALTYCTSNLANKNKKCRKKFCIAAGSTVAFAGGLETPIEKIQEFSNSTAILSWNPAIQSENNSDRENSNISSSGHVVDSLVKFFDRGVKKCVELKFDDYSTLRCTPDHKIVVRNLDGNFVWKRAGEILMGENIVGGILFAQDRKCEFEKTFSAKFARLILSFDDQSNRDRSLAIARVAGIFSAGFFSRKFKFHHELDLENFVSDCKLINLQLSFIGDLSVEISEFSSLSLLELFPDPEFSSAETFEIPQILFDPTCPNSLRREFLGAFLGAIGNSPIIANSSENISSIFDHRKILELNFSESSDSLRSSLIKIISLLELVGVSGFSVDSSRSPSLSLSRPQFSSADFSTLVGFRYSFIKQIFQSIAQRCWRIESEISFNFQSQMNFLDRSGCLKILNSSLSARRSFPPIFLSLISREILSTPLPVFDLQVYSNFSFIANGISVHNCGHCLKKFYKETPQAITDKNTWKCPSCRKICCCAACRRRKQKDAMNKGEEGHKTKKSKIHSHSHAHHQDDENSLLAPSQLLSNLSSPALSSGYELNIHENLLKDDEFNEFYKFSRRDDDESSNSSSDSSDGDGDGDGDDNRAGGMPSAQFQQLLESHIKSLAAQSSKDRQTPFAVLYKHAQTPRIKQKIIKILESNQIKKDKKVDLIANLLGQLHSQQQIHANNQMMQNNGIGIGFGIGMPINSISPPNS